MSTTIAIFVLVCLTTAMAVSTTNLAEITKKYIIPNQTLREKVHNSLETVLNRTHTGIAVVWACFFVSLFVGSHAKAFSLGFITVFAVYFTVNFFAVVTLRKQIQKRIGL